MSPQVCMSSVLRIVEASGSLQQRKKNKSGNSILAFQNFLTI
ncbi:MAG: hypothetical protein ACW96X_06335 [Promethearchaeota archaeon]